MFTLSRCSTSTTQKIASYALVPQAIIYSAINDIGAILLQQTHPCRVFGREQTTRLLHNFDDVVVDFVIGQDLLNSHNNSLANSTVENLLC